MNRFPMNTYRGAVDFGSISEDFSRGFVSGSGDGELGGLDAVDDRIEDEHPANAHLIGRQSSGFVRENVLNLN